VTRRRGGPAPVDAHERWQARKDARGQWQVVDSSGEPLFSTADPLERIEAVVLAAQAPDLRHALRQMTERYTRFVVEHSMQHRVDQRYAMLAFAVLADTRPPFQEVAALRRRPTLELVFGDGGEQTDQAA
jgi:hypothetical protein